jgi:uncharacterized repeat protein (TIGR04076 family)
MEQGSRRATSQSRKKPKNNALTLRVKSQPRKQNKHKRKKSEEKMYKVTVQVKEVRGNCALGYKPGDTFTIEKFYIKDTGKGVCLHALAAMLTLPAPLLKGVLATALGIGEQEDTGYAQCPDPGKPYTCGGTVVFELKREK